MFTENTSPPVFYIISSLSFFLLVRFDNFRSQKSNFRLTVEKFIVTGKQMPNNSSVKLFRCTMCIIKALYWFALVHKSILK